MLNISLLSWAHHNTCIVWFVVNFRLNLVTFHKSICVESVNGHECDRADCKQGSRMHYSLMTLRHSWYLVSGLQCYFVVSHGDFRPSCPISLHRDSIPCETFDRPVRSVSTPWLHAMWWDFRPSCQCSLQCDRIPCEATDRPSDQSVPWVTLAYERLPTVRWISPTICRPFSARVVTSGNSGAVIFGVWPKGTYMRAVFASRTVVDQCCRIGCIME